MPYAQSYSKQIRIFEYVIIKLEMKLLLNNILHSLRNYSRIIRSVREYSRTLFESRRNQRVVDNSRTICLNLYIRTQITVLKIIFAVY